MIIPQHLYIFTRLQDGIPEYSIPHKHGCENFKYHYIFLSLTVCDFVHKYRSFNAVNHFQLTRKGLC